MKKITALIACAVMMLITVSCGTVSIEPSDAADKLVSAAEFSETLSEVSSKILIKKYGLDESIITDAAGYCGTAAVVDEIAVFKTTDTAAVEEAAQKHIQSQKESYTSYAPNEVPKLDDAVVKVIGDCVVVCVSNGDSSAAVNAIAEQ